MVDIKEIPEWAICPKCKRPLQVIDFTAKAARLGYKVPDGSYVIACCGAELTINDEDQERWLKELLIAYHGHVTIEG
jgi:hypothetical protein